MKKSNRVVGFLIAFAIGVGTTNIVLADYFVYPKEGQSKQQQNKDEYECHQWAVKQTGYDPLNAQQPQVAATEQSAPQQEGASGVGTMARGAAVGATVGAIGDSDHVGQDAAWGAVAGALVHHRRQRMQQQAEAQQQQAATQEQQQQQAKEEALHNQYNAAAKTCLQARGYQVS